MTEDNLYKLKFPVGEYEVPNDITKDHIKDWMWKIEEYPTAIHGKISTLTKEQLNWVYRPNGWSISQVVHHLADSHMNSLIRFKLALTEDNPVIKPYLEDKWAVQADYDVEMIGVAFKLLQAVHAKWYRILKSMAFEDFSTRSFYHPESKKRYSLGEALGMYDWHCRHHRAHISQALQYEGSF